uniref:Uncharacterized protein n=1 Tax=Rhizophora mucronata TaxID=61149 RepID=A0A2P2QTS2_RHIMU
MMTFLETASSRGLHGSSRKHMLRAHGSSACLFFYVVT